MEGITYIGGRSHQRPSHEPENHWQKEGDRGQTAKIIDGTQDGSSSELGLKLIKVGPVSRMRKCLLLLSYAVSSYLS